VYTLVCVDYQYKDEYCKQRYREKNGNSNDRILKMMIIKDREENGNSNDRILAMMIIKDEYINTNTM
jgi:hypothetical protein